MLLPSEVLIKEVEGACSPHQVGAKFEDITQNLAVGHDAANGVSKLGPGVVQVADCLVQSSEEFAEAGDELMLGTANNPTKIITRNRKLVGFLIHLLNIRSLISN